MSSLQINQFVFPDAYAQRTSCFNRVDTVAGFHAFDERGFSGVRGGIYRVHTVLVQRYGVQRGKDAYVGHFRFVWVRVAVTVHGKAVGNIDKSHVPPPQIFYNGFGRVGHALQKRVVIGRP